MNSKTTEAPKSTSKLQSSDFEIEIGAHQLKNSRGEVYHTIPAETCRIGIVSRRRIGSGPDGKDVELPQETEAAFIRGNGAWLPPLFCETNGGRQ